MSILKMWVLFSAEICAKTPEIQYSKRSKGYSVDRLKVLDSVHTVDSGAVLLLLLLRTLQLRRRGVIPRFSPLSIESTTVNRHQRYHDINTTGRERLIRSHSSARFCFELSGNSN